MDADMAIDPRAIPQLLDALQTSDLAIGSRALPDSMVDGTYAVRAVMGRLFNRLVTAGTGLGLLDTQCGFKSFRTPAARLLFHLVRIDRFAFDVEVLARARRLGLRITEIPVQWKHVAGSTIHPLQDPLSMLADVYRSRFGLLATPPVPAIVVLDATGDHRDGGLADEVRAVVAGSLGGEPVPVVGDSSSAMVLLPLVDTAATTAVLSALRAEFEPMSVYRRSLSLEGLVALGALSGRLQAPPAPGGTA
jgi:hypothetical protein